MSGSNRQKNGESREDYLERRKENDKQCWARRYANPAFRERMYDYRADYYYWHHAEILEKARIKREEAKLC